MHYVDKQRLQYLLVTLILVVLVAVVSVYASSLQTTSYPGVHVLGATAPTYSDKHIVSMGSVEIEAENYNEGSLGASYYVKQSNVLNDYRGDYSIIVPNENRTSSYSLMLADGSWAEYSFLPYLGGDYSLSLSVRADGPFIARVHVNEGFQTIYAPATPKYESIVIPRINLIEGKNDVRIEVVEGAMIADSFSFVKLSK